MEFGYLAKGGRIEPCKPRMEYDNDCRRVIAIPLIRSTPFQPDRKVIPEEPGRKRISGSDDTNRRLRVVNSFHLSLKM